LTDAVIVQPGGLPVSAGCRLLARITRSPVAGQVTVAGNEQGRSREEACFGGLGLAALVSIGAGGGILSVLGPTGQMAGGGAYLSFVAGGIVAAVTGWSYSLLRVRSAAEAGRLGSWTACSARAWRARWTCCCGWAVSSNAPEDARDPARTLPRACLTAAGGVMALDVSVASWPLGNLSRHATATDSDHAPAAAARPFPGPAGFTLIAVVAVVSTSSPVNATL
jgi:hypothetical protein